MSETDQARIAVIVEGHGEVEAVPILLRRVASSIAPERPIDISKPIRVSRNKLLKQSELERYLELAQAHAEPNGGVLVLIDADDDCPVGLANEILARAARLSINPRVHAVVAKAEFESWFLAAARSLAGQRGLPEGLVPPVAPEAIRDAKGWLTSKMTSGQSYSPTLDQPALAARMDLAEAQKYSPSFNKFYRSVRALL